MTELMDFQNQIKEFCKKNKLEAPLEHRVLDTISELGEVSKEILKASSYGKKDPMYRPELKLELGDLLYSLITIANYFDINLEEALNLVLKKYENRLKKGSIGSEND